MTPPKLGRYEIVDEIGKGAMGVVYLARDPLIGRLVALKTFRIGYSIRDQELEQFRIRFMREAQSAGILSHPNIVTIHDVVEQTEEGLAFIAMEYVRGTTLKALLQSDQPMSLAFVVDLVAQIAEALDYAHAHRVIHRDVKPANILITADNKVKITDFGIARLDTSNLTQEGQLLGTPNYMAPEQIQGKEIDHRADLFALGVVLYEMLTRHKPFQGENLTVVSHRIVYDHFTPPKEHAKDLPPGVEQVLDRALDKDPARRYQRAKDMADDLRRMLNATRDDLNETLSIAAWAPGTEPHHATPPGGTTMVSGASPGAAIPQAAAMPNAPNQPNPSKIPRQPMSPRRLFLSAGVAAVVAILAAAAILLGISWSGGPEKPAAEPVQNVAGTRYAALVRAGEKYRDTLKYPEAIQALKQALPLAPEAERPRIQLMIEDSEERLANFIANQTRAEQIVTHMIEARLAMQDHRFADAAVAADAVLLLDPAHAEALQTQADAQKGMANLRQRPRTAPGKQQAPREQIAAATPQPIAPSATPQQSAETAAQPAKLRITLGSAGPEATVRIQIKGNVILNHPFKGRRTRLLRRAEPFSADKTIEVPAGSNDLQIYVALRNKAADFTARSGFFQAGETRILAIQVSESGEVSVNLN
ncbi:MAG TPA: serine/threonine-protein kinase [Thermoanaerobaculia bacterium]|jgi:serine/threonine protein kinase|nr:serine/threonine-protein kinase [Thermoanaerobaculia bacterium]